MLAAISPATSKVQPPTSPYLLPPVANVNASELPALCEIKLLCSERKKRSKHHVYLTFVESLSVSTPDEQPCLEIVRKKNSSSILLNACISFECFEKTKSDFQSFIYIYFPSYTVSIFFPDQHLPKKPQIVKHLESMYRNTREGTQTQSTLSTTEHILHTFDTKLIPYQSVITCKHELIGSVRLYFTTTDLYIASIHTARFDLTAAIVNQCPSKEKLIMCIPYFTIKHYGNRSAIFLLELGKSNYGDGEIRMKCQSSALASTIHLLASPIIEERPLALCSAFSNQFLTHKRIEKSKNIHPPILVSNDSIHVPVIHESIVSLDKISVESMPNPPKSPRSFSEAFRKLVRYVSPLHRSSTVDTNRKHDRIQADQQVPVELADERHLLVYQQTTASVECPPLTITMSTSSPTCSIAPSNQQDTPMGSYFEMSPVVEKADSLHSVEVCDEETAATADVGTNTTISLSPHVRSAIIIGNSVHLIAEEKVVHSIGQRSFTSPASVLQPFKSQLHGQPLINTFATSFDMNARTPSSSSSFHQPVSSCNSRQSLLLSYGIVTFNSGNHADGMSTDPIDPCSSLNSDGFSREHRLDSDFSLMSLSHQQQPANVYPFDSVLSSASSSSQIFRTLSVSTNNMGDNPSGSIVTSNGSIIFFDEKYSDQPTNYLLGPPMAHVHDPHRRASMCRSHVSQICEETRPFGDSYALVQPLPPNPKTLLRASEVTYTDLFEPSPVVEKRSQSIPMNDQTLEDHDQSIMVQYADIDHQQTQLSDRRAKLATMSSVPDRTPPFVL